MKHITIYSLMIVCFVFTSLLATSCNSDLNSNIKDDPYSGGKLRSGSVCWLNLLLRKALIPMIRLYLKLKGC